jgi:NaMN:DMB phosphoribosyltransferase
MAAELEAMQAQPDPQAQLAESLGLEARAKAAKAEADTEYALARAEETRAKTIEILTNVSDQERAAVLGAAQEIRQASQPVPMAETRGLTQ